MDRYSSTDMTAEGSNTLERVSPRLTGRGPEIMAESGVGSTAAETEASIFSTVDSSNPLDWAAFTALASALLPIRLRYRVLDVVQASSGTDLLRNRIDEMVNPVIHEVGANVDVHNLGQCLRAEACHRLIAVSNAVD